MGLPLSCVGETYRNLISKAEKCEILIKTTWHSPIQANALLGPHHNRRHRRTHQSLEDFWYQILLVMINCMMKKRDFQSPFVRVIWTS